MIGQRVGDLLQTEIFVASGPVEDDVAPAYAEQGSDLGDSSDVHPEVAEHLVPWSGDSVRPDAAGFAEKEECAPFFPSGERVPVAAREAVERGVGEDEGELELGDSAAEHAEIDFAAFFRLE
jgi:hypothetical protein